MLRKAKNLKKWKSARYRVFSPTRPASMQIYWNKRKRLHKKRVQLPQDWFRTPTWPHFHGFGTAIWPPWRHVKTLYIVKLGRQPTFSRRKKRFPCRWEISVEEQASKFHTNKVSLPIQWTGVFFAWACATADLSKSTRPVTATVLHGYRNQIVHFESLLEIEMVAGT